MQAVRNAKDSRGLRDSSRELAIEISLCDQRIGFGKRARCIVNIHGS